MAAAAGPLPSGPATAERDWLHGARFAGLPETAAEGEAVRACLADSILLFGSDALEGCNKAQAPTNSTFCNARFFLAPPTAERRGHDDAMLRSGLALAGANSFLMGRLFVFLNEFVFWKVLGKEKQSLAVAHPVHHSR